MLRHTSCSRISDGIQVLQFAPALIYITESLQYLLLALLLLVMTTTRRTMYCPGSSLIRTQTCLLLVRTSTSFATLDEKPMSLHTVRSTRLKAYLLLMPLFYTKTMCLEKSTCYLYAMLYMFRRWHTPSFHHLYCAKKGFKSATQPRFMSRTLAKTIMRLSLIRYSGYRSHFMESSHIFRFASQQRRKSTASKMSTC